MNRAAMRGMRLKLLLALGVLALYATGLEYAPIYLHHDEVLNAVNGYSMASTGRDPNGRVLPLYFYISNDYWATPIVAYVTALFLLVLPVSEVTIRLASVLVGLISVLLMFAVAKKVFNRDRPALIAAGLLALTPAHFIHSRLAVDQLYPLPFLLGWLWCLATFLEPFDSRAGETLAQGRRKAQTLFLGTLLLGLGVYTYLGSLVMMPVYGVLTAAALFKAGHRSIRPYLIALAGFVLPVMFLVPWHLTHPAQFGQQIKMYDVYDSSTLGPLQGLREILSYSSLASRASAFHQGFNPSMLFFTGGSSLINGTSRTGVFLFPIAVFLPVGIYRLVTGRLTPMSFVLLCGLASAPLAGALVEEATVNRMLVILPFAILVSTFGVEHLLTASDERWRRAAIGLLLLVPLQFIWFYADYMGDYRRRSGVWFERNIRGAIEELVAHDSRKRVPAVYLSTSEILWIDWYWKFFLAKYRHEDLIQRTVYFSAPEVDLHQIPPGAVVLSDANSAFTERLARAGIFQETRVITEPDGKASFTIFERILPPDFPRRDTPDSPRPSTR